MDIAQVFDKYGVPVAMLVCVVYALYKISCWFASTVVEPLLKRHLEFMDKMALTLQTQTELLASIHANQTKIIDLINRLSEDQVQRLEQMEEQLTRKGR